MPVIDEEHYRASLRDNTCVACDRTRPWWAQFLFWEDCRKCGAHHCRHHRNTYRGGSILTGRSVTWDCLYCDTTNSRKIKADY